MGEIIAFPSNARRAPPAPPFPFEAQILFFLGVRYMRLDDAATKGAPHRGGEAGGGKKRKKRA